ncbi:hypothetical protein THAOC_31295, partial [Thalassiosira oceanica]
RIFAVSTPPVAAIASPIDLPVAANRSQQHQESQHLRRIDSPVQPVYKRSAAIALSTEHRSIILSAVRPGCRSILFRRIASSGLNCQNIIHRVSIIFIMSDGNSRGAYAYSLSYNWSESSGPNSQGTGSVTLRRSGTQGQVQNRRNPELEVQPRLPPRRVVPVHQVQFPFDRHSGGPGPVYQGHHEQQGTMSPSNSTISSRGSVHNNNGSVGGGSRCSTRGSTRGSHRSIRGSTTRNTLFPQANQFHRHSSGQSYHGGPARQQSRSLQQISGGLVPQR